MILWLIGFVMGLVAAPFLFWAYVAWLSVQPGETRNEDYTEDFWYGGR